MERLNLLLKLKERIELAYCRMQGMLTITLTVNPSKSPILVYFDSTSIANALNTDHASTTNKRLIVQGGPKVVT